MLVTQDRAAQIWNADEAGFPLCPSIGKVIDMLDVFMASLVTARSRLQPFAPVSVVGDVIPARKCFKYRQPHEQLCG